MTSNIQVAVRIRPLNQRETLENHDIQMNWSDAQINVPNNSPFLFDRIFGPESTNQLVYSHIANDIIEDCLNGIHTTIFAYGQTSSGKTYTMNGSPNDPGIIKNAIQHIFDYIENVMFSDNALLTDRLESKQRVSAAR